MAQPPPDGYGPGNGYGPGYGPGYGGPPPWFGVPQAPRPGCVPLRPLGLGDILDGAFSVVRRNPRTTLGLSAVVSVIQVLITAGFQVVLYSQLEHAEKSSTSTIPTGTLVSELSSIFSLVILGSLLGAILTGMLTVVVTQDVLGIRLPLAAAWARIRPRIWPLVGLSVIVTLIETLGLALCLAPGIWLWGIWALAVPAFVVEGLPVRAARRRSRELVAGSFWRVWGIRALGALLVSFISGFAVVPFELIAGALSGGGLGVFTGHASGVPIVFVAVTSIGSIIAATLTAPLRAAIDALLYVDMRMRKEGLDLILQRSVAGPPR